jgi:hypothetical protein
MKWQQVRVTLVFTAVLAGGPILTTTSMTRGSDGPVQDDLDKSEISTVGTEGAILTAAELEKLLGVDPWIYARLLELPQPLLPVDALGDAGEVSGPTIPAVVGFEKESLQTIVTGPESPTAVEIEKAASASYPVPDPGTTGGER